MGDQQPPLGRLEGSDTSLECADSPISVLTSQSGSTHLGAFDPRTNNLSDLGAISCPGDFAVGSPNSLLAVDHRGHVYVAYGICGTERIYRIDPSTMVCVETPFIRNVDPNYKDCLMEFSFMRDTAALDTETLFFLATGLEVPPAPMPMSTPYYLGRVDPETGKQTVVGALAAPAQAAHSQHIPMAGDQNGQLFLDYNAYASLDIGTDIGTLDVPSATATTMWQLTTAPTSEETAWYRMFAYWRDAFYLFTYSMPSSTGEIIKFTPADGSATTVAPNPRILAVGAAACSPQ